MKLLNFLYLLDEKCILDCTHSGRELTPFGKFLFDPEPPPFWGRGANKCEFYKRKLLTGNFRNAHFVEISQMQCPQLVRFPWHSRGFEICIIYFKFGPRKYNVYKLVWTLLNPNLKSALYFCLFFKKTFFVLFQFIW